jgi:hypothetical protein
VPRRVAVARVLALTRVRPHGSDNFDLGEFAGLAVDPAWFENVLYPFQDEVLAVAARVETGFYLTGGTALGRVHLRHRYSEDLDLFVNDDDLFQTWADRLLAAEDALAGASSKAVGVFAADVARVLLSATPDDWRLVRWIPPPPPCEEFLRDLRALGEGLLLVR